MTPGNKQCLSQCLHLLKCPGGTTADEIGQTIAASLEWIVKARLADLLNGGLTHAEVFKLLRVADDYHKGELGPETLATIHDPAGKLDT